MSKINTALVSLKLDTRVGDFVNIIFRCKCDHIERLYLKFNEERASLPSSNNNDDILKKKLKFASNAYKIGCHIDSDISLHFLLQTAHPTEEDIKKNTKWSLNDLEEEIRSNRDYSSEYVYIPTYFEESPTERDVVVDPRMTTNYDKIVLPPHRDYVALGGTFDRLHNGHFYLLTTACLLATKSVGVGVTKNDSLYDKVLHEMIEPLDDRVLNVYNYLNSCNPKLQILIDHLIDSVGFSGTYADFQVLVTSKETERGIEIVNSTRNKNGLNNLSLYSVDLLSGARINTNKDMKENDANIDKLSSTSKRFNELGYLRKPVTKVFDKYPYIIGITGNICSGKSSICRLLEEKGAHVINCDIEAHNCYSPYTDGFNQIVATFGDKIVEYNKDLDFYGIINRKKLGELVFSNHEDLKKLTAIIWPKLRERVLKIIEKLEEDKVKICVIEAAILYEAGFEDLMHEVWFVPIIKKESIKRIMDRNQISLEEATKRLNAQLWLISSKEKVKKSNVILSTAFHKSITNNLVEKAWSLLQQRLYFNK